MCADTDEQLGWEGSQATTLRSPLRAWFVLECARALVLQRLRFHRGGPAQVRRALNLLRGWFDAPLTPLQSQLCRACAGEHTHTQLFEMLEAVAKALDRPVTGAISDDGDDSAVERSLQILQFVDVLHKQVLCECVCATA